MVVQLEARIRKADGTVRLATADGDYEAAKATLEQTIRDGEQLLSLRRFDD